MAGIDVSTHRPLRCAGCNAGRGCAPAVDRAAASISTAAVPHRAVAACPPPDGFHASCSLPWGPLSGGGLPTPARTGKVRGTNVAPICMKFSTVQTSSQCLETQAGRGFTPDRAAGVRETAVGVMQQFCSL